MQICRKMNIAKREGRNIVIIKEVGDILNRNGLTELMAHSLTLEGFCSTKQEACEYLKTISPSIQDESYERASYVNYLVEEFDSLEEFGNVGDIIVEFMSMDETTVDLAYYTTAYPKMIEKSSKDMEVWVNA